MSTKKQNVDLSKRSTELSEGETFGEFQDWCLRTYGDSGKTKTVTRRKYNKILQTLLQSEDADAYMDSNHINAKFKFWVKSKGFQVGNCNGQQDKNGTSDRPVLYVPIKAACVDGTSGQDGSFLKRVAVVEDFYDIIYAMHVEISTDPAKAPKHAGQKKTYKAIAETYAFLPREAVTRFLMSCGECQKRMHVSWSGTDSRESERPASLVPALIDYNMPLTTTYLKQMKLRCLTNGDQDESSVSSEEFDMSDPTWISAEHHNAQSDLNPPISTERMHSPQNTHKEEDDDSSSESGSGNGAHSMTPPSMGVVAISDSAGTGPGTGPYSQVNGNGTGVPLDFSTTSSSSSEERQPMHLRERQGQAPPTASTMLGTFNPEHSEELRRKYPRAPLASELRLERDIREYANKSPQYGAGTYDSIKMEMCAEDLTVSRSQAADDDDDDHDDHDDSDKINDTEGVDPERLKAFNMFVRLFVDENLDRMVPISKQPKEKIQAIIESCSRQFPEFQERARKRIRTYLKSCRRMKKNGMETRPTPPHLTSAMAENILAAACESETRNAAKRMRMDVYQTHEDQIALDKAASREPVPLPPSAYPLAASAYSQDQLYINGGLSYTYRAYSGLGGGVQHPIPLTTNTAQSNGPTDLSMKSLTSNSSTSSTSSLGRSGGGGGGGASAQLSHTEVAAVRQLIAGYRESAAFLLRSADELENLILQQN
ncbi:nucleolar protein 4-like b isoform X2 [Electrophorus electricus]|uniref:nucleolar protein 4-like b isoform X2 n=1 Tax=Electrophorus electricus TaxID=8005 RepID=UPI0015D05E4F|nr:nucleolar protein 4-like b isoform X2 [Electrophorus electricus]